ncbi:cyclic nucleotide-binding protein, partial [Listeria monocytogenes]|nr:cyclic nucleotide-binding protein [Listeria monocytogenes]
MKKINDTARLSNYIDTYDLQSYMDNDLLAMATLHSFEKEEHLIRTGTPSEYLY